MILAIFLTILGMAAAFVGLFFVLRKYIFGYLGSFSKQLLDESFKIAEQKNRDLFKEARDILFSQYRSEKEIISEKMQQGEKIIESKKDAIKDVVERIGRELEDSKKQRIGEFNTLKTIIEEHKIITSDLKTSTDDLKNVLSNNQLRGKYGEEVAENLLISVGFVKGQHYTVNTAQDTKATRPDFTIFLPDKTKINIDAKFPFQSLLKFQEAQEKQEKERYIKEFANDVKQKIKEVASREYINPEEKTVDFVILFIPNEMIFSFIYEHLNDVWEDAFRKKVIMAGPFSFTAILRTMFQAYKNFRYQENLQDIVKLIKVFEAEYSKFNDELDTLGKRLKTASDQFDTVSITRTKKLTNVVEKIKSENLTTSSDLRLDI